MFETMGLVQYISLRFISAQFTWVEGLEDSQPVFVTDSPSEVSFISILGLAFVVAVGVVIVLVVAVPCSYILCQILYIAASFLSCQ